MQAKKKMAADKEAAELLSMDPEQRAKVEAEKEAAAKHSALKTKHMARLGAAGGVKKNLGRGGRGRGGRGRAAAATRRPSDAYDSTIVADPVEASKADSDEG